jgi:hypothetical protein
MSDCIIFIAMYLVTDIVIWNKNFSHCLNIVYFHFQAYILFHTPKKMWKVHVTYCMCIFRIFIHAAIRLPMFFGHPATYMIFKYYVSTLSEKALCTHQYPYHNRLSHITNIWVTIHRGQRCTMYIHWKEFCKWRSSGYEAAFHRTGYHGGRGEQWQFRN